MEKEMVGPALSGFFEQGWSAVQRPESRPKGRPLRILLAEDNAINRLVTVDMLKRLGHTVEVVRNGEEALLKLGRSHFDAVLMDIQMPEMDGFTATEEIRRREAHDSCRLPILALTAHALRGYRERCLDAGMDGYLTKPFRATELEAALAGILPECEEAPQSAPRAAAGTSFDLTDLMQRVEGDTDVLAEMLDLYQVETPRLEAELGRSLAAHDARGVQQAAHALRGTVGTFGARRAASLARDLEMLGNESALSGADVLWGELERELAVLGAELSELALHSIAA